MGGSNSKEPRWTEPSTLMESVKATVQDELSRRAMLQREVQMAVNIAKARDTIWIFGSAWTALTAGVATAHALGRPVPGVAGVPVVVGALVLGNLTDMAYGNKLARVSKEAEYILEYERGRFVPFRQAPFSKFYSEEERASLYKPATAVGELFPNYWWARHHPLPGPSGESK